MINKVILIGNLGSDPEIRYTQSGTAVASLSVATTRKWKDKDGQKQEETEWHRVNVWAQKAEFCGNYLKKGSKVYVEGRLQTRKWKDQDNKDRFTTEIVAEELQNLSPRDTAAEPSGGYGGPGGAMGTGEDIPFSPCFF